jgi:uncharacterized protein
VGLRLPAEVAIGVGLITQVFGFASGLVAYARKGLIEYRLGLPLLAVTVPAAVAGSLGGGLVGAPVLKILLSVALLALALAFLRSLPLRSATATEAAVQMAATQMVATQMSTALSSLPAGMGAGRGGGPWGSSRCNPSEAGLVMGAGAPFLGLIATGLGELSCYYFLQRCRTSAAAAVATTVFIVAFTALPASAGHFVRLALAGDEVLRLVLNLVLFTIPGVLIGGQIGAAIAGHIPQRALERGLAILFVVVAVLTLRTI